MTTSAAAPVDLVLGELPERFSRVRLGRPTTAGFVLLTLEVDRRPPLAFGLESEAKRALLGELRRAAGELGRGEGVIEATVFRARLAAPGRGEFLRQRPHVAVARFDVVLLVELASHAQALALRASAAWRALEALGEGRARRQLTVTASSPRRIAPVDHGRPGVFLFNYFHADDLARNLAVWEHTAGWFQDRTGLDNSVLLVPDPGQTPDYTIINHCRWDRLRDVLPSLLFDRTFRRFVLASFAANRTAAMPILYELA